MKIIITVIDEQNGSVKLDCNPPIQTMIDRWKAGDKNPALAYAIAGIQKMYAFSQEIVAEQQREARDAELMNGLILPDPRLRKPKPIGPTEIN